MTTKDERLMADDGITKYGNLMTYGELKYSTYAGKHNVLIRLRMLAEQFAACGESNEVEKVRKAIAVLAERTGKEQEFPPVEEGPVW